VIVGRPKGAGELPQSVIHADNLFDAVGEVTVATASQPVSAVVVPTELVHGTAALAAAAFRRIDPSVRLILLSPAEGEAAGATEPADGFDEVLSAPLSAKALASILEGGEAPTKERAAAPAAQKPVSQGEAAGTTAPAPPQGPDASWGDLPQLVGAGEPHSVADAAGRPALDQLGDTDLVEAILTDPAGLRKLALQLMIEQTRWSDLTLSDEAPPGDGVARAEVRFAKQRFGTLWSREARERQLRPWAAWLARWLALDRGYRDFRTMAFQDELTGAWNRRFYDVFMKQNLKRAARQRRAVTVLVFDIDDFKHYNDEFGHDAGDEVLRETVRLLNSVIRAGDRVCRIGGDEFVVIFADPEGPREPGSNPPETVEEIAGRFQEQICQMKFPKLGLDAPGTLSISGGLATYPWDGTDPESLLRRADQLALQSKKSGKNVITLGPGIQRLQPDPDA
jgi:diguanylate cyclase (GGDEF)-like protein